MNEDQLDHLVKAVLASSKYRHVSSDLVAEMGKRELRNRRSLKAAIKATKNKLHQVAGAYHRTKIDYDSALELLQKTAASPSEFRAACQEIMRGHVSTRERLPIIDRFYTQTLEGLPPIRRVMDVGCGLNPLAWPWMPFDEGVEYFAYDIYSDEMRFIGEFMDLVGISGVAEVADVLHDPPNQPVDLAIILKTLPCLEQIDKLASTRLLDVIQARFLLISYPVASLGGRQKGMVANYDTHFQKLSAGRSWSVERFFFDTELAFFVTVGE